MKWIHKQLKNSTTLFSGLALLLASCLVGLPRAARAQSSGTPLSDVTLEQFMSALEARYSNTVDFNTMSDVWPPVVTDSDGNPVGFYVFPYDPDRYLTMGDYLMGPDDSTVAQLAYSTLEWVANMFRLLSSEDFSNALARVHNFIGTTYDSASGVVDVNDMYQQLESLTFSIQSLLQQSSRLAPGGAVGSPYALQVVDLGTPNWLDVHSANLGAQPSSPVLFVQDPLAAEKLDELIDGQNDMADLFAQGMPIAEDSLYQMGEEFRLALDDALGGPFSGTIVPESATALTNMVSSERDIMDTEGLMFTNAVYSVTGNVNQLLGSVDVGALSNDFRSLLGAFMPNSGRSTVLQLTPSLDISTRPGSPAFALAPIEVDLADSRFTVGGWPLWQVLRALCILGWWAWWFWFMYGFLHKWISKFASLMGS